MIVLDASVLIAHLNEGDAHHASAVDRLLDVADHSLAASTLTLAEVLVGPARADRLEQARAALRELDVREIGFARHAAPRLAALRADTALRLPDCCVLLAAQDSGAEAILTFDDRLENQAARLGLAVR